MPPALKLSDTDNELVAAYTQSLAEAGLSTIPEKLWPAKAFCDRVGQPAAWAALTLDAQLNLPRRVRTFVTWLFITGRLAADADYLAAATHQLGATAALHHPVFHHEFTDTAVALGFTPASARRQWAAVTHTAVLHRVAPETITDTMVDAARTALDRAYARQRPDTATGREATKGFFGAQATLFHLGITTTTPHKGARQAPAPAPHPGWAKVAPGVAATMASYLEQMALVQRPATTTRNEAGLRELGCFLADQAPEVACVADIRRAHIEAYKIWLAQRPKHRDDGTLNPASIANRLSCLSGFFRRLLEWDADDAPCAPLLFTGDLPIRDNPLPRFLDDAAAAKLLHAARTHPDRFTRLAVEVLARTGMRKGELLGLTLDSVVQIGSAYWLRIPLGKLHNDRYIPLHPQLKALLDDWVAHRPDGLRSDLMFIEHGRPLGLNRVDSAVHNAADAAGIGRVAPHQLRHTLATQAINRGMSLEAIATLLGHKTLSMTMVYARIADRTVADEYFAVTEKVEALYGQPNELPANAEGAEMVKLRREITQRMLGNGYCARPVEMDCHFESICESCSFFVTTIEFKPTLRRQRDDAHAKGQIGRQKIFDGLLERLDDEAS